MPTQEPMGWFNQNEIQYAITTFGDSIRLITVSQSFANKGRLRWPRQLILHLGRVQIQIARWVLGPETRHEAGQKVFVLQGDWKVSR